MAIKEVKAGEKYKLELLCIHNAGKVITFETPTGDHLPFRESDLECVSPANVTKYDPNRKLKKGDIVEPCQVKGRWHSVTWEGRSGIHFIVTEDEDEDGIISIKDPDCKLPYIAAAVFFNLVTPVEELEPYYVVKGDVSYKLKKGERLLANYWPQHPHAKAAAEAERDRLNAEHRKETK